MLKIINDSLEMKTQNQYFIFSAKSNNGIKNIFILIYIFFRIRFPFKGNDGNFQKQYL